MTITWKDYTIIVLGLLFIVLITGCSLMPWEQCMYKGDWVKSEYCDQAAMEMDNA